MAPMPTPREMGYYAALAQIGMEMVLPAVGGVYLDQWLETTPWITCVLAVVGFTGALMHLMAILQRKKRDESSDQKPPS